MRSEPSVLHLDLDAFFAAVEQRDKPSLRGKPVVVGGLGPRGVVSTASYEAREYGVHSAMPTAQARARCPHAAYLTPRAAVYRAVSDQVMAALRELSPVIEPLSLDEAFVELSPDRQRVSAQRIDQPDSNDHPPVRLHDLSVAGVNELAEQLRTTIRERTSITASVGAGTSKLIAKIASEQAKPDGALVVAPGDERALLHPLPIRALPGVGPVTAAELTRMGVSTVGDLAALPTDEVVRTLGEAHGRSLAALAHAEDNRPVASERESKSISVEDTFDVDITSPSLLAAFAQRMAERVAEHLTKAGLSARTVTLKARLHDFTTISRSATLPGPTDSGSTIARVATRLLAEVNTTDGLRLLGVGVSGITDWVQDDLFAADARETPTPIDQEPPADSETTATSGRSTSRSWVPGIDVTHAELGPGWVWGSGLGRVTVRFETADTAPGPVRTFDADDPALAGGSLPPSDDR